MSCEIDKGHQFHIGTQGKVINFIVENLRLFRALGYSGALQPFCTLAAEKYDCDRTTIESFVSRETFLICKPLKGRMYMYA
jgi:hypothetical protein